MTMRPSMSVMMTTDVPPVDADQAGVTVDYRCRPHARPGERTRVVVTLRDADTGKPVTDLTRTHEVWMHLIATRDDLGTFAHVHPEPTGRPGELAVTLTFPTAGTLRPPHRVRPPGVDEQHPRPAHHHRRRPAPHDVRAAGRRPAGARRRRRPRHPVRAGPRRRHLRPDVLLRRRHDRASRSTT